MTISLASSIQKSTNGSASDVQRWIFHNCNFVKHVQQPGTGNAPYAKKNLRWTKMFVLGVPLSIGNEIYVRSRTRRICMFAKHAINLNK